MTYLLDTNVCIALINGRPTLPRERLQRAIERGDTLLLSSIVAYELWYGVGKSEHKERNRSRLETFLSGPMEWVPFDDEDAREAGAIRAELETSGQPIGAYDVLLAGQGRRRGSTIVTSNTNEFDRVANLPREDWAQP